MQKDDAQSFMKSLSVLESHLETKNQNDNTALGGHDRWKVYDV